MGRKFDAGLDSDGKVMYFKNCSRCDVEMVFRNLQLVDYTDMCPKCLKELAREGVQENKSKDPERRTDM